MYKILKNNNIIDVIDSPIYVKYQSIYSKIIVCPQNYAEGVISSDGTTVYNLGRVDNLPEQYETVQMVEIDEDEYNLLKESIDEAKENNEEVSITNTTSNNTNEDYSNDTIEFVKSNKIKSLSDDCTSAIQDGFDIKLSDNVTHHFALTIEDQINMIALKNQLDAGESQIAYHGSNELCKYFSSYDIQRIINMADSFKNYHILYFNSLKNYVKSLTSVADVRSIEYGDEIPSQYKSSVFVNFLKNYNI